MMIDRRRRWPRAFIIHASAFAISHCVLFFTAAAWAQVVRLPAVEPPSQSPPGQLMSHPDSSAQILQAPGQSDVAPASPSPSEPQLPPGVRNGVFQKVLFDATWLAPGGSDGMGMNDLQLQGIFALPCPTRNSPLVITPGFAVHYLEGPQGVDLPPQLHEGYAQFRWLSQATPTLGLDFAVTPGIFSDFQQESGDGFRLTGHGATAWTWSETAKIVLGAAYLDRPDAGVIPIGGVIWTPHDELTFDLVFPHPKISRRVYWGGEYGEQMQDWAYIAGEFAGDAWAIRRADGSDDQVVLSDYRVILGLERKVPGGLSSRFEIGYVFGRRIRYTSDTPEFRPSDTVMLRGGLTY
jgi:hypothetical protein